MAETYRLTERDIHPHLRSRMEMRGVSLDDVNITLANGWLAVDSAPGTEGRTWVFDFGGVWEGKFYAEKEVTVYFKRVDLRIVPLTAKARYGANFPRLRGIE